MPFSHYFKFIAILLIGLVSYPMAAAGKIRFAIGDERKIIDTKGKETDAKTGGKIREKDKVRTGIESQVIVALPDGSIISVEENSLVEFTNLNSSNGVQSAVTDIKQGKVRFDAQRQKQVQLQDRDSHGRHPWYGRHRGPHAEGILRIRPQFRLHGHFRRVRSQGVHCRR